MSETNVLWRVSYTDRITPSHVWVWDEESEDRARERYEHAVDTNSRRMVKLERVTWEVVAVEMIEETAHE